MRTDRCDQRTDEELLRLLDAGGRDDHIDGCPTCQRRLVEFRRTLDLAGRVPTPEWTPLRDEALFHGARRRLRARRRPRSAWKPALGGALAGSLVTGTLALLLITQSLPPATVTAAGGDPPAAEAAAVVGDAAQSVVLSEGEFSDEDVAELLESYLVLSASTDELLWELEELSEEDLYALLEE